MEDRRPLLAASLIVRDEEQNLIDCLASIGGVVDEIVVHDTGSTDATVDIALRAGARLIRGRWQHDFALARNIALDAVSAQWVLSLDADERLVADAHLLRRLLLGSIPHDPSLESIGAFQVPVVSLAKDGSEQVIHFTSRLFRRDGARWEGKVHENVHLQDDGLVRCRLSPQLAFLEHRGYTDAATMAVKAQRNLELAECELAELAASGVDRGEAVERVLYDLARSYLGVRRGDDAIETLVTLRQIAQHDRYRALAVATLAQTLLDVGGFEDLALGLEEELRAGGLADPRHGRWLRAQALAALGQVREATALLDNLDGMVDPAGIPLSMLPVQRLRERLAAVGQPL